MGNFCTHAAASPKSVREYEYIVYSCTIGDDWGGEVYLHFWQISAPPLKQAGSVPKEKKNECGWQDHKFSCGEKKGREPIN